MGRVLLRWLCAAAVSIAATANLGPARAQPLYDYYLSPPAPGYYPPPNYYPPPTYYAPRTYYAPPAVRYDPSYGYVPPPALYYAPPVADWVPPRPRSCEKYRYWDGDYCADARYQPPYVGPKW
jgi:hypothetical protein